MSLAVEHRASPNHGERAAGKPVDMIILHYTGMASAERAVSWLCDPESGVSSHYVVFEDGRIVQLVDESRRAWHAGKSYWAGETDINSRSVGIEIANPGHEFGYRPFPDRQIEQNRRRHDRNMRAVVQISDAFVLQKSPHTSRGFESERAAARETDAVDAIGDVHRIQHVPLFRSGGRSADIAARHRTRFAQDDGTPRQSVIIGSVPDQDTGDIGEAFHFLNDPMLASTRLRRTRCSIS